MVQCSTTSPLKAPRAAYLKARISGCHHHCLLDSGADVSLAPAQYVDPAILTPTSRPLLAVNNTSLAVDGTAQLPVTIGKQKKSATFFVTPNVDEFILGRDWLAEHSVVWDFSEQTVRIGKETIQLNDRHRSTPSCKRAVTCAQVTIPPRSEAILPSYIIYSRLDDRDATPTHWTTTLNSPVNGFRVVALWSAMNPAALVFGSATRLNDQSACTVGAQ